MVEETFLGMTYKFTLFKNQPDPVGKREWEGGADGFLR
jgi:hypothetical protein